MNDKPALLGNQPVFAQKLPLVRPVLPSFADLEDDIRRILSSGMVTKGAQLAAFERDVATHVGADHAVGVSSCTTGLMLSYKGLGLTGEVICPSFTFMATVSALVWAGLRPVFADIHRDTTNIDAASVRARIGPRTSAVVATHNFGNPADIAELAELCQRHRLKLIFDAAHGLGSLYQGRAVGSQGDVQVFSLSPTKLVIAGEGGMVTTNDSQLAESVRSGREYGNDGHYGSRFAGVNGRMPELSALLGRNSLRDVESAATRRNEVVGQVKSALVDVPGLDFQRVGAGNRSSYKDLALIVHPPEFGLSRDQFAAALRAENIDTRNYYDPPVHRPDAYRAFYDAAAPLPHTDFLASNIICLPIWSNMDDGTVSLMCRAIRRIHDHAVGLREHFPGADRGTG